MSGHGTCDYVTLLQFLQALDTGRRPVLDEARAGDVTAPGLVAAESAIRDGEWLDVARPPV